MSVGYTLVGTADIERARGFFDRVLAEIGMARLYDGGHTTYWGTGFAAGAIGVCRPFDRQVASVGNGTMVALVAPSRAAVEAAHRTALALGAANEGQPGVRAGADDSAFYAAYFRDLDGNKFSVFRIGAA